MTAPFALNADEGLAVAETAVAFAAAVPADRGLIYRELAAQAVDGEVEYDLLPALERVLVLALETGKAREIGKAETERHLLSVFRRTPGGKALSQETADVNKVLAQFQGKELTSARISARMPGKYQLDLSVDGFSIAITLEPGGLEVRSVEAGA
jgi:hypothetical protein